MSHSGLTFAQIELGERASRESRDEVEAASLVLDQPGGFDLIWSRPAKTN